MKNQGVVVRPMENADADAWDEFVRGSLQGTFFHLSRWRRVIEEGLSHKTWFLLAEQNGTIRGILPLAEIDSWFFGHYLVSLPCCVYGGIVAAEESAKDALTQAACDLAGRLGVSALEMRNLQSQHPGWPNKEMYVTFRRSIFAEDDENLKAIPRKQRAMIRKGIAADLRSRTTQEIDEFYPIYAESVRNLGTPVFPKKYFFLLTDVFSEAADISIISHKGQDVAAVLSFFFRNEVLPYYGGSRPIARALKGNDFMYWDLMCRSARKGVEVFDFGRSKVGTGSYSFKKNWGFTEEKLHYEYFLVNGGEMPQLNPNNPKYKYFIKAWKSLPLSVANFVGPMLARNLG